MTKLINEYSAYVKEQYGRRVQKLTVDAGFTCPNRDGKVAVGGCTYCNNDKFNPGDKINSLSITEQIDAQVAHTTRRYKNVKEYIIYFQAYSNTYADLKYLKSLYEEALAYPGVIGLAIGTRPDCVSPEIIDYLEELAKTKDITIEYGLESIKNDTLVKINRGHDYQCFVDAMNLTTGRGIKICVHMIIGFAWENLDDWIMMAKELSSLPIDFLKLHQLHVVKHTVMAAEFKKEEFKMLTKDEYLHTLEVILSHLNPNIVIQRMFSEVPRGLLVSHAWNIPMTELIKELKVNMVENGSYQGMDYQNRLS